MKSRAQWRLVYCIEQVVVKALVLKEQGCGALMWLVGERERENMDGWGSSLFFCIRFWKFNYLFRPGRLWLGAKFASIKPGNRQHELMASSCFSPHLPLSAFQMNLYTLKGSQPHHIEALPKPVFQRKAFVREGFGHKIFCSLISCCFLVPYSSM